MFHHTAACQSFLDNHTGPDTELIKSERDRITQSMHAVIHLMDQGPSLQPVKSDVLLQVVKYVCLVCVQFIKPKRRESRDDLLPLSAPSCTRTWGFDNTLC